MLQCVFISEDGGGLVRKRDAVAMAEHGFGLFDLTYVGRAAQLAGGFDQGKNAVHAWVADR